MLQPPPSEKAVSVSFVRRKTTSSPGGKQSPRSERNAKLQHVSQNLQFLLAESPRNLGRYNVGSKGDHLEPVTTADTESHP
jgi:hypothetical protein